MFSGKGYGKETLQWGRKYVLGHIRKEIVFVLESVYGKVSQTDRQIDRQTDTNERRGEEN